MLLASAIASTVVLLSLAIWLRVSPDFTVKLGIFNTLKPLPKLLFETGAGLFETGAGLSLSRLSSTADIVSSTGTAPL